MTAIEIRKPNGVIVGGDGALGDEAKADADRIGGYITEEGTGTILYDARQGA